MQKIFLAVCLLTVTLFANSDSQTPKDVKNKEGSRTSLWSHDKSQWGASVKKKMHKIQENNLRCGAQKCGVSMPTSSKCGAVKIPTH